MKLIFAIIRYDNEDEVVNALTQKRFSITKLSSTGGFLRKGNTTLMIGTEEERRKTEDHHQYAVYLRLCNDELCHNADERGSGRRYDLCDRCGRLRENLNK